MKQIWIYTTILIALLSSCNEAIKNEENKVVNEIDSIVTKVDSILPAADTTTVVNAKVNPVGTNTVMLVQDQPDLIGFWVGYFKKKNTEGSYKKDIYADEGLYWNRENKINISIDQIADGKVKGHSVVAGNNRPFEGTIKEDETSFAFELSEPGDDKYDGKFSFTIKKDDSKLEGTWKAYKKIDIQEREYKLKKSVFTYNLDQKLDYGQPFGDWENVKTTKLKDKEMIEYYGEFLKEYATATNLIYEVNASNTLLKKKDVENLKKGDLLIIRNTVYARHGYSFKNRPLRVFFDAQEWYIPVHNEIINELTDIEKQNIELLLRYEKNAKEYYDRFGRG